MVQGPLESLLKQSNIDIIVCLRIYIFRRASPQRNGMPLLVVFIASILQTVGINVSLYSFQVRRIYHVKRQNYQVLTFETFEIAQFSKICELSLLLSSQIKCSNTLHEW